MICFQGKKVSLNLYSNYDQSGVMFAHPVNTVTLWHTSNSHVSAPLEWTAPYEFSLSGFFSFFSYPSKINLHFEGEGSNALRPHEGGRESE